MYLNVTVKNLFNATLVDGRTVEEIAYKIKKIVETDGEIEN